MKLVVICALMALAAARVEPGLYEPSHLGPVDIDFDLEPSTGSITKEELLDLLRRLRERLANLRPRGIDDDADFDLAILDDFDQVQIVPALVDGVEVDPSIESLEDLREWLRELVRRLFYLVYPDGLPEDIPRPPSGSVRNLLEWARKVIRDILPFDIDFPALPVITPQGIRNYLINLINNIWPNGIPKPESGQAVLEWLINTIRYLFPDGITIPKPSIYFWQSMGRWMYQLGQRVWPQGISRPERPPMEDVNAMREWMANFIDTMWPPNLPRLPLPSDDTDESFFLWVTEMFDQLVPGGIPRPYRPNPIDTIRELIRRIVDRCWPEDKPRPRRLNGESVLDLNDWISEVIDILEVQSSVKSLEPVPVPNVKDAEVNDAEEPFNY